MNYLSKISFLSIFLLGNIIHAEGETAKNTSLLIRVEIYVKDDIEKKDGKVNSVYFNNRKLYLTPPDPEGERGSNFFQLPPGKYILKWSTKVDRYIWPRDLKHKKIIELKKEHGWTFIKIEGDKLTIIPKNNR